MSTYYNEHDPKAAATLRELIREGLIAPGDVDERSIEDVTPAELMGYTQCHFFAGYGIWSWALRLTGWPDDREVWTGSCPCQPFSAAGKGKGFTDERHLWPAWFHLIQHGKRPGVPVYGEQVASPDGLAWLDLVWADMEAANHTVRPFDLCSAGFGAPIIRQRTFWVASAASVGRIGRRTGETLPASESIKRSERCGDAIGLERPSCERWFQRRPESSERSIVGGCVTGGMGSTNDSGSQGRRRVSECSAELAAGACGVAGGLDCADGGNAGTEREQRSGQHGLVTADGGTGELLRVDGTECLGRGKSWFRHHERHERIISDATGSDGGPGPTNGWWRNADWLRCRDDKWRPVEPGTFPLAHGYPERVGLLRGAGNAISPFVAAAFIQAHEESMSAA